MADPDSMGETGRGGTYQSWRPHLWKMERGKSRCWQKSLPRCSSPHQGQEHRAWMAAEASEMDHHTQMVKAGVSCKTFKAWIPQIQYGSLRSFTWTIQAFPCKLTHHQLLHICSTTGFCALTPPCFVWSRDRSQPSQRVSPSLPRVSVINL